MGLPLQSSLAIRVRKLSRRSSSCFFAASALAFAPLPFAAITISFVFNLVSFFSAFALSLAATFSSLFSSRFALLCSRILIPTRFNDIKGSGALYASPLSGVVSLRSPGLWSQRSALRTGMVVPSTMYLV